MGYKGIRKEGKNVNVPRQQRKVCLWNKEEKHMGKKGKKRRRGNKI